MEEPNKQPIEEEMSALDGIRIRVEASTGLHDRPLHYQGNIQWYNGDLYNLWVVGWDPIQHIRAFTFYKDELILKYAIGRPSRSEF